MKKIFLAVLLVSVFLIFTVLVFKPFGSLTSNLYGKSSQESEGLSTKEVQEILTKLNVPDAKIIEIKRSPIKGLWEVTLESGGRKGVIYVDVSKKYMVSGSIISVEERKDITQERLIEINKVDVSQIPLDDALLLGDREATEKVIVFTDPD